MLAVLSGGGTAGHINPALALAEELKVRDVEVCFAGTPTGVESRLVPDAGISFTAFEASGFDRSRPLTMVTGTSKIMRSTGKVKRWFEEIKPDVVVGFGGYVCIPVARGAHSLNIPVVVHEQNSVMGMANKYLAGFAKDVCVTYACSAEGLSVDAQHVHVTGNPVRTSVVRATRGEGREYLGISEDARMLLVFGGSLGARHINEAIIALKDELLSREDLFIVHITGPREFEEVTSQLALSEQEQTRWLVKDYEDNMGCVLAAADAVVSRAGATSIAEISALSVPALLVPYPFATDDHQTTNARAYVDEGCALMIPDDKVESSEFSEAVFDLIDDSNLRETLSRAAHAQNTAGAAARLADVVMAAARE